MTDQPRDKIESPAASLEKERQTVRASAREAKQDRKQEQREEMAAKSVKDFSLVDEDPKQAAGEMERVRDFRKFSQGIKPTQPTAETVGGNVDERKQRDEQRPQRQEDYKAPVVSPQPITDPGAGVSIQTVGLLYDSGGDTVEAKILTLNNVTVGDDYDG